MGEDKEKALLPIAGKPLIDRLIYAWPGPHEDVTIITNSPEKYEQCACQKIVDLYPGCGPMAGIHAGLNHATADFSFFAACDLPLISKAPIQKLLRHHAGMSDKPDVLGYRSANGFEPLCAIYAKRCLPTIEGKILQKDLSLQNLKNYLQIVHIEIKNTDVLFNMNTAADYLYIRKRLEDLS
jgi:molybdopterin-guanine dinucleotide biosynthesis protein A